MYTRREEFFNTLSHGLGVLLGVAGLVLLLQFNSHKTEYSTFSILLYGISLIALYAASTIYHAAKAAWKPMLRKLDHISIYFLIAGTYTPLTLISLKDSSGWPIFWTVWIIAALGTIMKIFLTGRFEKLSLFLYLLMGWLIIFDIRTVFEVQTVTGLVLMGLGGLFYTLGTIFYMMEKIPYNHAIWHVFVLAGSIFHFFFIFLDVI